MKYCGKNQDPSKIIKNVEKKGNYYYLMYMDESETNYYCSDENKYDKIIEEMINQAKERQEEESIKSLELKKFILKVTSIICMGGAIRSYQMNAFFISSLLFILGTFLIKQQRNESYYLEDLKKYKIYLELIKDGKKEISNISEFERYYRQDITINNIDEFDLSTLKYIKKYQNKIN